ncbi:2-hydroxyacid dehydrogenase [Ningiella sp. W23]|uniref:2-hydroxyacid dehydrogenase n=1 Tax=Ningiella sp. W23 TaxID=3023715 RepID=UPI003756C13F
MTLDQYKPSGNQTQQNKVIVFSSQAYDKDFLTQHCPDSIEFQFFETKLDAKSVVLASGFDVVSVFVNDTIDAEVIDALLEMGVEHIALRCAGYNNVDVEYANERGMAVSRVPAYSPQAVAEHTIALMMALNRKLHKAYNRVKEGNFDLNGLLGFNLYGKTVGIIGTGKIGQAVINILLGFGCKIICYDVAQSVDVTAKGAHYTSLDELTQQSDIISLHCPLLPETKHLINNARLSAMKEGVMLINTSRGKLVDTKAVINAIKRKHIGALGLDVYEMEENLFFKNRSSEIIEDDVFQRLLTFPNVLITGHQGFFTHEALTEIAQTTISNIEYFASQQKPEQEDAIASNFL